MPLVGRVSRSDRPAVTAVPAAARTAAPTARRRQPAACRTGRHMHTHIARESRTSDARERSFLSETTDAAGAGDLEKVRSAAFDRADVEMPAGAFAASGPSGQARSKARTRMRGCPRRGAYVPAWCSLSAPASGSAPRAGRRTKLSERNFSRTMLCGSARESSVPRDGAAAAPATFPGTRAAPRHDVGRTSSLHKCHHSHGCPYIRVAYGLLLDRARSVYSSTHDERRVAALVARQGCSHALALS